MAHWAEIDENNIVLRVVVGDNNDPAGDEGYSWLVNSLGGRWIKTSFNSRGNVHYGIDGEKDDKPALRKNFAGIGYIYDEARDAFIAPQPAGDGWVFDEEACTWSNPSYIDSQIPLNDPNKVPDPLV